MYAYTVSSWIRYSVFLKQGKTTYLEPLTKLKLLDEGNLMLQINITGLFY